MGGTGVLHRVVVGVVVRDVVGVVVINEQFNTGCIRFTKREKIKKNLFSMLFFNNIKASRAYIIQV